jgi:ABC-type multidrug transport system ATPase subunit
VSWPIGIANCIQPMMTGLENARFACRIQGLSYEEMKPITDFVDSFAELGKYFDMPVRLYSSGMRARLGFAITMAFDFDFYILDEVTATGDKVFRDKARQIFEEKRRRSAFIRASHNFRELLSECDSGLVLHNGKLEQFASIEKAVDRYLELIEPAAKSGRAPGRAAEKWRKSRDHQADGKAVVKETTAPGASAQAVGRRQSAGQGGQPPKVDPKVAKPRAPATIPAARIPAVGTAGEPAAQTPPPVEGSGMPLHRLFGLRPENWSR